LREGNDFQQLAQAGFGRNGETKNQKYQRKQGCTEGSLEDWYAPCQAGLL
jgi:hypothetical protein